MTRIAKNKALQAIHNSIEDAETEVEMSENDKVAIASNEPQTSRTLIPKITQNAPDGMTLDLSKHYNRKLEYCDRELMRIHDKSVDKNDQGSEDKGLIYVDFQAGMFEALKMNFIKCIVNEYNIKPIAQP